MGANLTLVHVCASCGPLLHRVAQLAVANERALRVLTFPKHADVGIQVTLVHIDARLHVHRSHEAIITETAILPRNVGTLAAVTDIGVIFTLINICARPSVWHQCVPLAAAALVASFGVGALGVAAPIHYHTLVDICTALAVWRGLVSRIARALVSSDHVHTFAISTEVVAQGALVNIYTVLTGR